MGKDSGVQWGIEERNFYSCGFWQGCQQISAGCKNCYAKAMLHRWRKDCFNDDPRIFRVENATRDVLKWNRVEAKAGTMGVVFINPQADFWEVDLDNERNAELQHARQRAFYAMAKCENLFFLILTKRSAVMREQMWGGGAYAKNVGFGVTVENADNLSRVEDLIATECVFRFVSCEPLLGPLNFEQEQNGQGVGDLMIENLDWVIVGGESGPRARPTHPDWVRSVRDQCKEADVPFLFKQWGSTGLGRLLDGVEHMAIPEVLK